MVYSFTVVFSFYQMHAGIGSRPFVTLNGNERVQRMKGWFIFNDDCGDENENFLAECWHFIMKIVTEHFSLRQLCHYVKKPVGVSSQLNLLHIVAVRRAERGSLL